MPKSLVDVSLSSSASLLFKLCHTSSFTVYIPDKVDLGTTAKFGPWANSTSHVGDGGMLDKFITHFIFDLVEFES